MTKIVQVPFSKVQKLAFPELVNTVVSIVSKHNPDAFYIRAYYNFLLEAQTLNNKLSVANRNTEESKALVLFKQKRNRVLSAIIGEAKNRKKVNLPAYTNDQTIVSLFIEGYIGKIQSNVSKIKTERIKQMLAEMDGSSALQQAIQNVGLMDYMNELKNIQLGIDTNTAKDIEQKAARPKLQDTAAAITKMRLALRNLLGAIEFGVHAHPDVDYTPLINELNELLVKYSSEIKAKATRTKNATQADAVAKSDNKKVA